MLRIPTLLRLTRPALQVGQIRIPEGRELESFLLEFRPEEKIQARDKWRQYAGRKDLLDPMGASRVSYRLDTFSLDYVQWMGDKRKVISADQVKQDINRFARGISNELRDTTVRLSNGFIDGQEWYDESARTMKLAYRAGVDVARGSSGDMSQDDNELWLLLVLALLLLLNRTAEALLSGGVEAGRLRSTMVLRGGAISGLFENWRLKRLAPRAGYTEARRYLRVAEHCEHSAERPGCVELAAKKWVPIWQMVPIGGATCRDNCKCRIRYRGRTVPTGG